jgi:hypothetical protein
MATASSVGADHRTQYKSIQSVIAAIVGYVAASAVPLNLILAAMEILNQIGITIYYGFVGVPLHLVLISPSADNSLFWVTFLCVIMVSWYSTVVRRERPPVAVVLSHMILPVILLLFSVLVKDPGLPVAAYFAALASIITLLYVEKVSVVRRVRAISIAGIVIGLTYIVVAMVSLLIMNTDPARTVAVIGQPYYPWSTSERLAQLDFQIFYASYPCVEYLLLFFLFAWTWVPLPTLIQGLLCGTKGLRLDTKTSYLSMKSEWKQPTEAPPRQKTGALRRLSTWLPRVGAASACLLGVYIIQFPYHFQSRPIGVDASFYVRQVSQIHSLSSILSLIVNEPRAPYLLLLFGIRQLTGITAEAAVAAGPIILIVFLAAGTYAFTAFGVRDEYVALAASALSVFSVQTAVGLYSGIYTNWFALGEVALFYAFLTSWIDRGSKLGLVGAIVFSNLVLVTHQWTWGILIAALTCQSLLALAAGGRVFRGVIRKREFISTIMIADTSVAFAVLVFFIASALHGQAGIFPAILSGYEILKSLGLRYAVTVQHVLSTTITQYVGGFLANSPLFALAILGAWEARRLSGTFQRTLFSILLVSSILTVLLDSWYQWRVLFVVPYYLAGAIGIRFFARTTLEASAKAATTRVDRALIVASATIIILAIIMAFVNYTFRSIIYLAALA